MIDEETLSPFKPVQCVLVYKRHSDYYLEMHDILEDQGKYQWLEGKPLAKEHLTKMVVTLGDSAFTPMKINGILPENLLYFQQSFTDLTLIWWLPPSEQTLHFKDQVKLPEGRIKLPGLIFSVVGKGLDVFAVKGDKKPTLKCQLYKAPFYNTSSNGDVCMGNVKENKQKAEIVEEMKRWEKRFFNSYFTHLSDDKILANGFNLQLIFKELMKTKAPFPEQALAVSPRGTLDKYLKKVSR